MEAEKRNQQIAEQKRKEAEARAKAQEEARLKREAEAAKKRQEMEAKRVAAEETRRKLQEEAERKRAEAQRQREEQVARATAAAKAAKASASIRVAPPPKKVLTAPRGVPTLVGWSRRRDGGISGRIYGSPNFNDGQKVETTAIVKGELENGSVVQTGSGSRYFLSDVKPKGASSKAMSDLMSALPGATITLTKAQKDRDAATALDAARKAVPRQSISLFGGGGPSAASAAPATADKARPSFSLFGGGTQRVSPQKSTTPPKVDTRPTLSLFSGTQQVAKAAPATKPATAAPKPRATFSLFGGGGGDNAAAEATTTKAPPAAARAPAPKQPARTAPRGVPTISGWRKNGDGTITGNIRGSPNFKDGQKVTTSPITQGTVNSGEVVKTGSGSRYFLA